MSIRSFATGMLAGLAIPAVILLLMMAMDGHIAAGQVALTPTKTTTTTPQTGAPGSTKTTTPTVVPQKTAIPSTTATPTKQATKQPTPQSTPTKAVSENQTDYQVKQVEVPAGRLVYMVFNLAENNILEGSVQIDGGDGTIVLWATEPGGNNIIPKKDVTGQGEFSIPANKAGQYTLYLDNSKSTKTNRQVTVSYRLRPN